MAAAMRAGPLRRTLQQGGGLALTHRLAPAWPCVPLLCSPHTPLISSFLPMWAGCRCRGVHTETQSKRDAGLVELLSRLQESPTPCPVEDLNSVLFSLREQPRHPPKSLVSVVGRAAAACRTQVAWSRAAPRQLLTCLKLANQVASSRRALRTSMASIANLALSTASQRRHLQPDVWAGLLLPAERLGCDASTLWAAAPAMLPRLRLPSHEQSLSALLYAAQMRRTWPAGSPGPVCRLLQRADLSALSGPAVSTALDALARLCHVHPSAEGRECLRRLLLHAGGNAGGMSTRCRVRCAAAALRAFQHCDLHLEEPLLDAAVACRDTASPHQCALLLHAGAAAALHQGAAAHSSSLRDFATTWLQALTPHIPALGGQELCLALDGAFLLQQPGQVAGRAALDRLRQVLRRAGGVSPAGAAFAARGLAHVGSGGAMQDALVTDLISIAQQGMEACSPAAHGALLQACVAAGRDVQAVAEAALAGVQSKARVSHDALQDQVQLAGTLLRMGQPHAAGRLAGWLATQPGAKAALETLPWHSALQLLQVQVFSLVGGTRQVRASLRRCIAGLPPPPSHPEAWQALIQAAAVHCALDGQGGARFSAASRARLEAAVQCLAGAACGPGADQRHAATLRSPLVTALAQSVRVDLSREPPHAAQQRLRTSLGLETAEDEPAPSPAEGVINVLGPTGREVPFALPRARRLVVLRQPSHFVPLPRQLAGVGAQAAAMWREQPHDTAGHAAWLAGDAQIPGAAEHAAAALSTCTEGQSPLPAFLQLLHPPQPEELAHELACQALGWAVLPVPHFLLEGAAPSALAAWLHGELHRVWAAWHPPLTHNQQR